VVYPDLTEIRLEFLRIKERRFKRHFRQNRSSWLKLPNSLSDTGRAIIVVNFRDEISHPDHQFAP
jgi:hypothetical protein